MNAAAPRWPRPRSNIGLKAEEYDLIVRRLNREPNHLELGVFSVMWSEHCSYKSSRLHLAQVPDHRPAGDPGTGRKRRRGRHRRRPGRACSRWNPTTTPRSSSPTRARRPGVGGIMRDVFTMGARPIALLNALQIRRPFASRERGGWSPAWSPASAATATASACRRVGGETNFHPATTATSWSTPCAWAWPTPTRSSIRPRPRAGLPVVYFGSKTGRDGIHGATMASAEFDDEFGREATDGPGRRSRSPRSC